MNLWAQISQNNPQETEALKVASAPMAKHRMRAAARNFADSEVASPAAPVRRVAEAAARVAVAAGCAIWEWTARWTWRVASHAGLS